MEMIINKEIERKNRKFIFFGYSNEIRKSVYNFFKIIDLQSMKIIFQRIELSYNRLLFLNSYPCIVSSEHN